MGELWLFDKQALIFGEEASSLIKKPIRINDLKLNKNSLCNHIIINNLTTLIANM